jgi:hypothetical protein
MINIDEAQTGTTWQACGKDSKVKALYARNARRVAQDAGAVSSRSLSWNN